MFEIVLSQCQVQIGDNPLAQGGKVMRFIVPNGIIVTVPLDADGARNIAALLTSGIIVATGTVPEPPHSFNGRFGQ